MVLLVAVNMNNTSMNTEEPSYFERVAPTQNPKNPKILGKWGGALASTRGFLGFWVLAGTILLKKEEGRQPTPREGRQPTPRTQKPKKPRVKGQAPSPFPQNLWVFWVLGLGLCCGGRPPGGWLLGAGPRAGPASPYTILIII